MEQALLEHVDRLEELARRRNRLAYELAYASASERGTQQYLVKESRMNAYTRRLESLRRTMGGQTEQLD